MWKAEKKIEKTRNLIEKLWDKRWKKTNCICCVLHAAFEFLRVIKVGKIICLNKPLFHEVVAHDFLPFEEASPRMSWKVSRWPFLYSLLLPHIVWKWLKMSHLNLVPFSYILSDVGFKVVFAESALIGFKSRILKGL